MEREERKKIYQDFMQGLEVFTENVHLLAKDAALSNKEDFLRRIAQDVNHLYSSCSQIIQCHDEDAEEIGSIVQCIFEQPLAIEKQKRVTILTAAKEFPEQSGSDSDLSFIMKEYVKHPETTQSFLRELEILTEDMQEIFEAIA